MYPQRLNTAIQKYPAVSASARPALRWWLRKSQALMAISIVVSFVPLFLVPWCAGVALSDALLLFVVAGGAAVLFCCGYFSLCYLLYALVNGVVRRRLFVTSNVLTIDILMLSLCPPVSVLYILHST